MVIFDRTFVSAAVVGGLTVVALAGCGSEPSRQAAAPESSPATSSADPDLGVTQSNKWVEQVYGYKTRQYYPASEIVVFHLDGVNATDEEITVEGGLYAERDNYVGGSERKTVKPRQPFHLAILPKRDWRDVRLAKLTAKGPGGADPKTLGVGFGNPPAKLTQDGNKVTVTTTDDVPTPRDAVLVIGRPGDGTEYWKAKVILNPGGSSTLTFDNAKYGKRYLMFVQDPTNRERRLSSSIRLQ